MKSVFASFKIVHYSFLRALIYRSFNTFMPITRGDKLNGRVYDYVVIGGTLIAPYSCFVMMILTFSVGGKGGTAGCVLASRLSEDPANHVLLLEAGSSDGNLLFAKIPMFYPELHKDSRYDWGFETVKQKHAHDRELIWPRGKMLGGCSNVNAMIVSFRNSGLVACT